ncbi:MAG TPA: hypothetical protein VHC63_00890 [Acidimicrobiales bacterium]|nr:hypothetical protein [Acidimicrobiales bacterium]
MTTRLLARGAAVAVAVVVAVALLCGGGPAQAGVGDAVPTPDTVVPPLPPAVDPATAAVSPVMWQACNGVGLAVGLVVVAGTLAGVPPQVGVPLNRAVATASGPALTAFFELCQQIPLPDEAPDCATDQQLPALPTLGRPVLPFALLANELRALDHTLSGAGVPLNGALSRAADNLLQCADGHNPAPDPQPEASDSVLPSRAERGDIDAGGVSGLLGSLPSLDAEPGAAGAPAPSALDLPPVGAITTPGRAHGAALAFALLALTALSVALWVQAGNARPAAADDDATGAA